MRQLASFAITCLCLLFSQSARADITLGFSDDGGLSFANTYFVAPDDSILIDVFLRDSDGAGVLVNDGLLSFGLIGPLTPTTNGNVSDTSINPVFDFLPVDDSTATNVEWIASVFNNAPPTGVDVLLGSFTFTATSAGSSTITFQDIDPGSGSEFVDWLSGTGAGLDEDIFGAGSTGTFEVSFVAIPEPTGCVVLLGLFSVWTRRRTRPK